MTNQAPGQVTSDFTKGGILTDVGYKDDTITICVAGGKHGMRVEILRTDAYIFAKRLMAECEPQPGWRVGETAKRAGIATKWARD